MLSRLWLQLKHKQGGCIIMYRYFKKTIYIVFVAILVSCGPTTAPTTEVVVQPPEATPTLDPTFTPSPAPVEPPTPSPTDTSTPEPTLPPITPTPEQAALSGRILDHDTNQPIADAQVSAGTANTTTGTDGRYTITDLPPGQYVLSVTHPDYDPGLSSIFTVAAGEQLAVDVPLYAPDTSPYPADPMLTNPLDPNGAPTAADAERLARLQGLTGEVVSIRETKLSGEFLVNYKIGDDIRAAVAEVRHEVWELIDETSRKWWIIKVCGNLASRMPEQAPIATPAPKPLPPMAEVLADGLVMRECAAENCSEVGTVSLGERVEVFGCLAHGTGDWCEVGWSGVRGWCTGQSLRQLAVVEAVPVVEVVLPPPTPRTVAIGNEKIIFWSVREGNGSYYIINADGTGLTQIDWSYEYFGLRSPNSDQKVTFARDEDIYTANVDGTDVTRLTDHPAYDSDPTWSPDGRQILFRSNRDDPDPENCLKRVSFPRCNWEIYVMNSDGSGLTNITNNPGSDEDQAWLPDGRIIFSRGGNIFVINSDGSGIQELTVGTWPFLSPDGTRFVFFRDDSCCMWLMNSDGSSLTLLSDKLGSYTRSGRKWSPNSQKIAFEADLRDYDSIRQIYVVNADGSGFMPLTSHPGLNAQPAWSPNGQKIAFVSSRDGNDEIYVMNADGSEQMRLTDRPDFDDIFPRWSR
jgi:Tol biopolymer transport system component